MKNVIKVLTVLLFFVISLQTQAQDNTPEYFMGKWNVTLNGPDGPIKMIVGFEKQDDAIIGSINDTEGKELYKVTKTSFVNGSATLTFIGSQGPVDLYLKKKDEDHITGDVMSMFNATGERIKE